jgi:hypothetical protein
MEYSSNKEQDILVKNRLERLWFELTDVEPQDNTVFLKVGKNSLDVIKLKKQIYLEFDVDISVSSLFKHPKFIDQVNLIEELLKETI